MPKRIVTETANPASLSRNTRKAIEGLKDAYRIGSKVLKGIAADGRAEYGSQAVGHFANEAGMGATNAYEVRNFALHYSRKDFEVLIEKIKQHDAAFGISHMIELLRIPDFDERAAIQKEAIENRYSVRKLRERIRGELVGV